MDYEQEKKIYISYCGSYCHKCDWHTGRIRKTAQATLALIKEYDGFVKLFEKHNVDSDKLQHGLAVLAESTICSGCKAEIRTNGTDRCDIRQCCSGKGLLLCNDCKSFPCDTLANNPGVIKFNCIENLNQISNDGLEKWIDKQWE